MKSCLICQTGQDKVTLTRIPISLEGAPWGDILVCVSCLETLGKEEVKNLIRVAIQEKSFEPANVILVGEEAEEDGAPGPLELPVTAGMLRDPAAFSGQVAEKLAAKLWMLHRSGTSQAVLATSVTPDGEGGFIFSATFAPSPS